MLLPLTNQRGLVIGIANAKSIAAGCAASFVNAGAEVAATYLNEKAEPYVRAVTDAIGCELVMPCDVRAPGQLEAVFAKIEETWGSLDFLVHSIAFAPREDLHGRVVDCSAEGFAQAMDISCHSFLRMARLAEPLMKRGGALLTISFFGADRVVPHYNMMGPVKAALESAVRYAAFELGPKKIRVNAISPGPMMTRAGSGIDHFDDMITHATEAAPEHDIANVGDVGELAAFLVSEGARHITGAVIPVDAGRGIMA